MQDLLIIKLKLLNKKTQKRAFCERLALEFLLKNKLNLVASNWYCRFGEIDLIMQDQFHLVFVEIRSKDNLKVLSAFESVDFFKQSKIIKSAQMFLNCNKEYADCFCRFDVVSIEKGQINWIKDAFEVG